MFQKALEVIQAFYYGLWANLSEIPPLYRASIVVLVIVCLAWFIARPICLKLLSLLMRLLVQGTKGLCLLGELFLSPLSKWTPERYLRLCNCWNSAMGKCHTWLTRRIESASKIKAHIGKAVLVYLVLMFLICLPTWVRTVVSGQYIPYLSGVSRLYEQLEEPFLQAAMAYEPLIIIPGAGDSSREEMPPSEPAESAPEESEPEEIWLSLSSKGRQRTNIREGAGADYRLLAVISGDEQVLYLGDQDGEWIHICRADGTEGWIHRNHLTPIPQEETAESNMP